MSQPTESDTERCWDCDHAICRHSSEYSGWDSRCDDFEPVKQDGTGCLVDGCACRRWFTIGPDWRDDPAEFARRAREALR